MCVQMENLVQQAGGSTDMLKKWELRAKNNSYCCKLVKCLPYRLPTVNPYIVISFIHNSEAGVVEDIKK